MSTEKNNDGKGSPRRAEPIDKRTARNGKVSYTFLLDIGIGADGKRKRQRYTYDTLAEARRELRKKSAQVAAGAFVGRSDLTVSQICDEWLKSRRDIRENTRRNYEGTLKYVRRDLGALKLQALRQSHVDSWVTDMLDGGAMDGKPLQPATVRLALVALKQVTKYAARQGLIARDPAEHVEAPKQKAAKVAASDIWTREQVATFADVAAEHRLFACYLLSCYGLRRSEVCGLRWLDVDLERETLSVEQGHVEVDGKHHAIDEPKTARSRRTLPMPADVTKALRELKTRQKREALALGQRWNDERHVCAAEDGMPVLPRTFTYWFQGLREKAGLPKITLRNLRHSSVSVMLHAGVPATTCAAWHGHDVRMTTQVYNRVYDEGLTVAASALRGAVEKVS